MYCCNIVLYPYLIRPSKKHFVDDQLWQTEPLLHFGETIQKQPGSLLLIRFLLTLLWFPLHCIFSTSRGRSLTSWCRLVSPSWSCGRSSTRIGSTLESSLRGESAAVSGPINSINKTISSSTKASLVQPNPANAFRVAPDILIAQVVLVQSIDHNLKKVTPPQCWSYAGLSCHKSQQRTFWGRLGVTIWG